MQLGGSDSNADSQLLQPQRPSDDSEFQELLDELKPFFEATENGLMDQEMLRDGKSINNYFATTLTTINYLFFDSFRRDGHSDTIRK